MYESACERAVNTAPSRPDSCANHTDGVRHRIQPCRNSMKTVISAALAAFLSLAVPVAVMAKSDSVPKAESKTAEEVIDFAKLFNNKLTDAKGKRVKSESLAKTKYVAVYFSAHWCGPCRQFTPELVKFTKENRKDGNFEVVFISLDTSDKAMLEYM